MAQGTGKPARTVSLGRELRAVRPDTAALRARSSFLATCSQHGCHTSDHHVHPREGGVQTAGCGLLCVSVFLQDERA